VNALVDRFARRQHQHGCGIGARPHPSQQFKSIDVRKTDIEQQQIVTVPSQRRVGVVAAASVVNVVPLLLQRPDEAFSKQWIVLDDKYSQSRVSLWPPSV
jgi:hypothetical protein